MERKKKILIVEDEAINALSLSSKLKSLGYDVCELAATGEQAIKDVEKERPDLILMDIILSGEMDGIEAAREIRVRYDIPIIFLTGYYDEGILDETKGVASSAILLKPFGPNAIETAIDRAFQKDKSHLR